MGNYIGIDAAGEAVVDPTDELDTGIRISDDAVPGFKSADTSEAERNVIAFGI